MPFLAADCARARESVSVQLDGELPELELDRLETHLRICPDCAKWAEQVRDVTRQLRAAALEVPEERFVLPRRARRWSGSSAVAVAAAAAVAAIVLAPVGFQHGSLGFRGSASLNSGRTTAKARLIFDEHLFALNSPLGDLAQPSELQGKLRPV